VPDTTPRSSDHGYHALTVAAVVEETSDSKSFVFDVPAHLRELFAYRAGQFCTVRARIGGDDVLRCYSMSSAPAVDRALAVTVKRVPGGVMSNWLNDEVAVGDTLELMRPSGVFCEREAGGDTPVLAFCGGSGITPVFSIVKQLLATSSRPIRLLYANRSRDSVIFGADLNGLQAEHPGRLAVEHHYDAEAGFLAAADIAIRADATADVYICGPTPFMDVVEEGLAAAGIDPARISIERFATAPAAGFGDAPAAGTDGTAATELTIVLKGKRRVFAHTPGDTVLDSARREGLKPPFSCELGNCASCMALVSAGSASMRANNALTPEEVAEGWVLTCQALPVGPLVVVEYEDF
jgi:3-ketosteroid 9alpha-monooxygenase subunit B